MKYDGFTTFNTVQNEGILTVTFEFGPVNVQGQEMLADLNSLALPFTHKSPGTCTFSQQISFA